MFYAIKLELNFEKNRKPLVAPSLSLNRIKSVFYSNVFCEISTQITEFLKKKGFCSTVTNLTTSCIIWISLPTPSNIKFQSTFIKIIKIPFCILQTLPISPAKISIRSQHFLPPQRPIIHSVSHYNSQSIHSLSTNIHRLTEAATPPITAQFLLCLLAPLYRVCSFRPTHTGMPERWKRSESGRRSGSESSPMIIAGTAIPATSAIITGAPTSVPSCHSSFFLRDQGLVPQKVQPEGLR